VSAHPPPAAAPTAPVPPTQAMLSLDIGEHFLNMRLKDERFDDAQDRNSHQEI
jgi:hypothetical protein